VTVEPPVWFLVAAQGRGIVNFGFALSLVLAGFAVVGVFIEIPFVSNYAFWIAIAAYVILAATQKHWVPGTAVGQSTGVLPDRAMRSWATDLVPTHFDDFTRHLIKLPKVVQTIVRTTRSRSMACVPADDPR
jgi:hypothetical protein